jgi:glycosyltransferase involved in cell wall biosynthesis
MRVLVVTSVHTPLDARIHHRQIRMLRRAGHDVTYAAPWSATGTDPAQVVDGVRTLDLPRSVGRRRLGPLRAARRLLRTEAPHHDLVLVHDPELLLALPPRRGGPPVVWDVHEDTAASLVDRPWVPRPARGLAGWLATRAESWAESRCHLTLAEASYAARFRRDHPLVLNTPWLPETEPPPPGASRIVYVGRVARSRGALEVLELARRLRGSDLQLDVIGAADGDVRVALEAAHARGELVWHGFVPNDRALAAVEGAAVGLSLVHPQPNHAGSLQTKVLEYLSRRVPVITTDLPVTGAFVRSNAVGIVVPVGDDDAVETAVRRLTSDATERERLADAGYRLVRDELNWDVAGLAFVELLERWAAAGPDGGMHGDVAARR